MQGIGRAIAVDPCPDVDPAYEGLEPEDWHEVPTAPERLADDWRDDVNLNRFSHVKPLVVAALSAKPTRADVSSGVHDQHHLSLNPQMRSHKVPQNACAG